jgi:hypothetical protein
MLAVFDHKLCMFLDKGPPRHEFDHSSFCYRLLPSDSARIGNGYF